MSAPPAGYLHCAGDTYNGTQENTYSVPTKSVASALPGKTGVDNFCDKLLNLITIVETVLGGIDGAGYVLAAPQGFENICISMD
jgi:hypothetical protein